MSKQAEHQTVGHSLPEVRPEALHISTTCEDGQTVVELSGSIVGATAGSLLDAFSDILSSGCKSLHLDLSGVHEVSRAGVRGIIVAAKAMQTCDGDFQITGAQESVVMVLDGQLLKALVSGGIQERSPIPSEPSEEGGADGAPSQSKPFWQWGVGS